MIFAWDPLSFNTQRATATFDRQASKTAPAAAGAVANR
jgi:hypothetical protein